MISFVFIVISIVMISMLSVIVVLKKERVAPKSRK